MELSPIATVLDMCQRTQHAHKKSMETLSTTYVKLAGDGNGSLTPFVDEFVEHTKRVLVVFKREQAVERVVDFMCKFASRYEPVAIAVLKFVVSVHNAKDKAVRFRACQIINNILKDLDEDTEIDDELWQGLQAALLLRIRDKIALVRVEAVKALTRLQLPEEEACPVVAEMLRVMATDSCSSVREAALESICINKLTLPAIISRLRDVTASVRAQARMKVMRVMEAGNVSEQDLDNSESLDASNGNTTMTD